MKTSTSEPPVTPGAVGNPALPTITLLLGIILASPIASQADATSKPGKPEDESKNQARRWVTFLELDDRRAEATNHLLRMGAKGVPALVQALNSPRPAVAQTVAQILRVLGSQAAAAKERLTTLSNSDDKQLAYLARYALFGVGKPAGITLIALPTQGKVIEVNSRGKVVHTLTGMKSPYDAERLPNGNYLVCDFKDKKVLEMTAKGRVVWSFAGLKLPRSAQRLPNGNTLIADGPGSGVLEVDRTGKTIRKYCAHGRPVDAERLVNGNTLIVDIRSSRVFEVTPGGEVVWKFNLRVGLRRDLDTHATDADRLPNGNTLIAFQNQGKVIEVTPKGKVVWELKGLDRPQDADRLPNGHTLVAQRGEVSEYDGKGKKVWSAKAAYPREVSRY